MNHSEIIIIGAGASGMMAAISAARNHAKVMILEHTDRFGKKILATGNGRCNLTNMIQDTSCYRSNNIGFQNSILEQFDVNTTLKLFDEIGICVKNKNGYIYPNSEQASSVLDVLRMELEHLKVKVICNVNVNQIKKTGNSFCIHTDFQNYNCNRVIIATGSKASPKTGSDGSGYTLAKSFGHCVIKPLPALVQLKCEGDFFKKLAGVRCEARLNLIVEGQENVRDKGEVQLTDYGISGIPTFQISRFAVRALDAKKEVKVAIDFMPDIELEAFRVLLKNRIQNSSYKNLEQLFIGLFNNKLISVLIKKANLSGHLLCSNLTDKQMHSLEECIKNFKVTVTGFHSFDSAQVCSGGVDTTELSSTTLESLKVPGLYFAGEVVDIDGICGGYNLQWAWSSGYVAGQSASNN
ncbi:MAG: NAD(P)/FAD-dependent oxidoreductase [Lachnotalea sp.]